MDTLEERVETLPRGAVLRVLDYGTGTALAAIETLKACRERGFEQRLARRGVGFELHLVDIPSSWFAQGHALVQESSWTQCHSLIGADGRFRPLSDVTGGVRMDVVMSSMVFHLIPPKALERVAESLAGITAPGGRLLWNAPDLGIPGPYAVPFHHPNRLVRAHWKKLLLGEVEPASPLQRDAIAAARLRAQGGEPLIDDARANKRILPTPHTGEEVGNALRGHFTGEVTTQTHEIVVRETLDTLLVPSNQEEYLPEIEDFALRSALIEELMLEEVLPGLRGRPGRDVRRLQRALDVRGLPAERGLSSAQPRLRRARWRPRRISRLVADQRVIGVRRRDDAVAHVGGELLAGVLAGGLVHPALTHLGLAVELRHRGLLLAA